MLLSLAFALASLPLHRCISTSALALVLAAHEMLEWGEKGLKRGDEYEGKQLVSLLPTTT